MTKTKDIGKFLDELLTERETPDCDRFLQSLSARKKKRMWENTGDQDWFVRGVNIIKKLDKKKLQDMVDPEIYEGFEHINAVINECVYEVDNKQKK